MAALERARRDIRTGGRHRRWPSFAPARLLRSPAEADLDLPWRQRARGPAVHHRIRQAVFVTEQGLFDGTRSRRPRRRPEQSNTSSDTSTASPAGTVRLYPVPARSRARRLWKGDRLAVLPEHRHAGLGGPLVRYAVATAGAARRRPDDRLRSSPTTSSSSDGSAGPLVGEPTLYVGDAAPEDEHRSQMTDASTAVRTGPASPAEPRDGLARRGRRR